MAMDTSLNCAYVKPNDFIVSSLFKNSNFLLLKSNLTIKFSKSGSKSMSFEEYIQLMTSDLIMYIN